MKRGTNSAYFMKIVQWIRLCWAFIYQNLVKFSVFVVLYLIVTLMGVKFGMEERTKFHSPSVQIEQCVKTLRAKNLKVALGVT